MLRVLIVAAVVVLSGCATTYQPRGFTGGFTETQLAPNVFRVAFNGNAYTDADRVADFVLLRSSELMLQNGYRYFVVQDVADRTTRGAMVTPTTTTANAYSSGNYAYGTATTTGGQIVEMVKPGASATVMGYKEKPHDSAWDAEFLVNSLRAKYKITP